MLRPELKFRAIHYHAAPADFAAANDFAFLVDRGCSAYRTCHVERSRDISYYFSWNAGGLCRVNVSLIRHHRKSLPEKKFMKRERGFTIELGWKKIMKLKHQIEEQGATGWILLWLLGIPIPVLFLLFLLRGCT